MITLIALMLNITAAHADTTVNYTASCPVSFQTGVAQNAAVRGFPLRVSARRNPATGDVRITAPSLQQWARRLRDLPLELGICGVEVLDEVGQKLQQELCPENATDRVACVGAARAAWWIQTMRFNETYSAEPHSQRQQTMLAFEDLPHSITPQQRDEASRHLTTLMTRYCQRLDAGGIGSSFDSFLSMDPYERDIRRIVFLSGGFIRDQLTPFLDRSSPTCRARMLRSVASLSTLVNSMPPDRQSIYPRKTQAERALLGLIHRYDEDWNSRIHDSLLCEVDATRPENRQLSDWAERFQELEICLPLREGESRRVSSTYYGGVSSAYRLRHDPGGGYTVALNLVFSSPGMPGNKNAAIHSLYTRMLHDRCLPELNRLLGRNVPMDRHLRVELSTDSDVPISEISIVPDAVHRSNSSAWAHNIDCATIAHELFHRLGLVDEYVETIDGYLETEVDGRPEVVLVNRNHEESQNRDDIASEYLCRAIGPDDSLMVNQWAAFLRVTEEGSPLLYSAQFRAITQPGCEAVNPGYAACSRYAQTRTPPNINGRACLARMPPECQVVPRAGQVPSWMCDRVDRRACGGASR